MLEDWLCGGPEDQDDDDDEIEELEARSAAGGEEGMAETTPDAGEGASVKSQATTAGDDDDEPRRPGPYVLVEKARLLNIYAAVFVARKCDHLVDGVSTGKVTAGLVRGRLGNKGGVGISLSFAGSRLLFISAHLAAHASGLGEFVRSYTRALALTLVRLHQKSARPTLGRSSTSSKWMTSLVLDPRVATFFLGDLK
jgi:hypothetical protein